MQQTLHRVAAHQVLLHDLLGVLRLGEAVPDIVWVDHANGRVLALVHAAGFQHADLAFQAGIFYQLLQFVLQFLRALVPAGWPGCVGVTLIHADKDLPLGNTHTLDATRRPG
jgi:hypothetical protein